MSFNIRFDNPADSPNNWQPRIIKVASQIRFHEADVIGVQEALYHQVQDLKQNLPNYGFVGAGRDDGKQKGEFSGIFYNRQKLELLEEQTFWLSLTPEVAGSKSWDAAITRIVTWAKFKQVSSGKIFYHFNTHFDHIGKEARKNSALMLLQKVKDIAGNTPAVITGDFNAHPADEPMQILMDKQSGMALTDSKSRSRVPHYGPEGTFNGFKAKESDNTPIDYILLKGNWDVLKHATLSEAWQGLYASDHFAVYALLQLP